MPKGRSTFTKRQKEQTRQQRQREKAERKSQRKLDKPESAILDHDELRQAAEAQAALFRMSDDPPPPDRSDKKEGS